MGAVLLIALLVFPFAEIALLIVVGGAIGVLPTLALLAFAVVAGVALIRLQGFATLLKVRAALGRGEPPAAALFEGACVVAAGLLLILPGFLSDALGLALLSFVPLRRVLLDWAWRRARARRAGGTVIEGEYETVEDGQHRRGPRPPSPWRRDDEADRLDGTDR
ncbi:MAG: FxsA family protein [Rhodospirillaceae bacterium]|nr:FxsA family protein [Rhodospirillaceae bacterium]